MDEWRVSLFYVYNLRVCLDGGFSFEVYEYRLQEGGVARNIARKLTIKLI